MSVLAHPANVRRSSTRVGLETGTHGVKTASGLVVSLPPPQIASNAGARGRRSER
jgi:hypothetical protein